MKKRLFFAAIALATLITLFYAWSNWSGARKLSAALAMLQERNEPTRFEDLVPPPVPDADNVAAAPVFRELFASEKDSRLGKLKWPGSSGIKRNQDESEIHLQARSINEAFQGDDQAAGELVLTSLAPMAPILEEVSEAVRRPGVSWPLDYSKGMETPLPHVTTMLRISIILDRRAIADLAVGRPNKAFEDVQTLFNLARAAGPDNFLICSLVKVSILHRTMAAISDGLTRRAWTDGQLAKLSNELSTFDLLKKCSDGIRMERALLLQTDLTIFEREFGRMFIDTGRPNRERERPLNLSERERAIIDAAWAVKPVGWRNESKAEYIEIIQRILDAAKTPKKLPATLDAITNAYDIPSVWQIIKSPIYLTITENRKFYQRMILTQTLLRSLATACAVERYRLAHGRLPETLDALVPDFLPSIPTDPLTGEPLHYKVSDSGSVLIYGTGWNQKDDAGSGVAPFYTSIKIADQADWGVEVKY